MRKYLWVMCICLLFVAGCIMFDTYDAQGRLVERGAISRAAEGGQALGAAGVPWIGLGGSLLGIIGAVGAYVKNRKVRKNGEATVQLLDELKKEAGNIANDEDVERLIVKYAPPDKSEFGKYLAKIHKSLKKI